MSAVLVVCATVVAVAAGSIYVGVFRAKDHVVPWESRRETLAALVLGAFTVGLLIAAAATVPS